MYRAEAGDRITAGSSTGTIAARGPADDSYYVQWRGRRKPLLFIPDQTAVIEKVSFAELAADCPSPMSRIERRARRRDLRAELRRMRTRRATSPDVRGGTEPFPAPERPASTGAGKAPPPPPRRTGPTAVRLLPIIAATALLAAGCKSSTAGSSDSGHASASTVEYDCTVSFVEPHPVLGGGRVTGEIQATCTTKPKTISIAVAVEHLQGDGTWLRSKDTGAITTVPGAVPLFASGDATCADGQWRTVYAWSGTGATGKPFDHPFDATGTTQTSDTRTVTDGECPK